METKYEVPPVAEYELKEPERPEVQTAQKSELAEALEILLSAAPASLKADGDRQLSLKERAAAFKKQMEGMEVVYGTDTLNASDRKSKE